MEATCGAGETWEVAIAVIRGERSSNMVEHHQAIACVGLVDLSRVWGYFGAAGDFRRGVASAIRSSQAGLGVLAKRARLA